MDISIYLKERKALVDSAMERILSGAENEPVVIHEAMRYSALDGGKRLRPILVLAACEAVGGANEKALPTACAIECIHTFSLIHDDLPCMDDDDFRRGRLSLHRAYSEAIAMLAGDALFALAFRVICETSGVPSDVLLQVCRIVSEAVGTEGMVGGQVLDMLSEGREVTIEQVQEIHRLKTGALIKASVVVGGLIGRASDMQMQALENYGRNIGLAFQIADDILDLVGDQGKLGKPVGSDLKHKKATYPSVLGVEESARIASEAVAAAISAVESFDERADPLRYIARFVVERES